METHIQIRFGELSTKGKNKKRFVQQLAQNVRMVHKGSSADQNQTRARFYSCWN